MFNFYFILCQKYLKGCVDFLVRQHSYFCIIVEHFLCRTLVQNLTFLLQMSKIQIKLLKILKIIYLFEVHKILLLQTKNCKINNFYKLYKTLLLENQFLQRRLVLILTTCILTGLNLNFLVYECQVRENERFKTRDRNIYKVQSLTKMQEKRVKKL